MAESATCDHIAEFGDHPDSRRDWYRDVWAHRQVLSMLAKKDFQTKYKRASFGVLWAIAVPMLQASIMAFVFSRVVKTGSGPNFAVYVIGGVVAYSYFSVVLNAAATAIVDNMTMIDKVWFPRVLLVLVSALSSLIGLAVTLIVLLAVMPLFHVAYTWRLLLLLPAIVLLIVFSAALSAALAALHVYFRDVRFLTQAALLVWLYVTPILYPIRLLGHIGPVVQANPLTGIVALFHMATVGAEGPVAVPVTVSVAVTLLLLIIATEAQRRHDRLFVDLL